MNLADPELELIDPTPDVHSLFVHFDSVFFWTTLVSRSLVRWSKRMYSCAGICSYEGRNGTCNIALSEPLLKLRPRKDLIETLLHEMIHAFLFITNRDNDRDGHGPNFQAHMYRINKAAGLNISIYHDFHDEVKLYLTHWWRCNGPCQKRKPYFGIVRRSSNRQPGPSDYWWESHRKNCGGTFNKIKEPEKVKRPTQKTKEKAKSKDNMKQKIIDVYVDKTKLTKTDKIVVPTPLSVHIGNILTPIKRKSTDSNSVIDKVRDVWRNKQLPTTTNFVNSKPAKNNNLASINKRKVDSVHVESPKKIKKIDDYFKATASSILKDLYGTQIEVTISSSNKLKAVTNKEYSENKSGHNNKVMKDLVPCPNCNAKVISEEINRHLDECLNKDIIEKLTKDDTEVIPCTSQIDDKNKLKVIIGTVQEMSPYKAHSDLDIKIKIEPIIKKEKTFEDRTLPNNNPIKNRQSDLITAKPDSIFNNIKVEPSTSQIKVEQTCLCCGKTVEKPIEQHLDECLAFFDNNTTLPVEGTSTIETIVIDDEDDQFDETLTLNATGTKSPCPCCLKMVEIEEMNDHLDVCLNI